MRMTVKECWVVYNQQVDKRVKRIHVPISYPLMLWVFETKEEAADYIRTYAKHAFANGDTTYEVCEYANGTYELLLLDKDRTPYMMYAMAPANRSVPVEE